MHQDRVDQRVIRPSTDRTIGESMALRAVLRDVEIVSPTNATVLIQGETGTGKELIARAVHRSSPRGSRPLARVSCAAIPAGLLESELFGHERGAFTGATARKIGRFELADESTLFLDEVGDIPLELQPKLLRVLQEHEFERLGGSETRRADVRIVAATCRDLSRMVAAGDFRSDLFYRINVFPIHLPPLRARAEDIPLLVRHFLERYAHEMGRPVLSVPDATLATLCRHDWPGNIRELQNVIERAVIRCRGKLRLSAIELTRGSPPPPMERIDSPGGAVTLEESEREHILKVLHETRWVVGGSSGAAAVLGVKRTTLISKMRKLGITRKPAPPGAQAPRTAYAVGAHGFH
jgi:formate hydrogenlyase transcriptional activator